MENKLQQEIDDMSKAIKTDNYGKLRAPLFGIVRLNQRQVLG